MAKHSVSHASDPSGVEPAPAPKSEAPTSPPVAKTFTPTTRDATVIHACLSRLARLHGYTDEHLPEHTGDIDVSGVSPEVAGLVAWARGARMP